jgi:hypothetical protein
VSPLVTASLFLTRIREEINEEEAEREREEKEQRGEGEGTEARERREVEEVKEEKEGQDEPLPSPPSISRIPDSPPPGSADDVHRFIVNYVKTIPSGPLEERHPRKAPLD